MPISTIALSAQNAEGFSATADAVNAAVSSGSIAAGPTDPITSFQSLLGRSATQSLIETAGDAGISADISRDPLSNSLSTDSSALAGTDFNPSGFQLPAQGRSVNTVARATTAKIKFSKTGVVTIVGSNAADRAYAVINARGEVRIGITGVTPELFKRSEVKLIRFFGKAGNDRFVARTSIETNAYGGAGNDRLDGGSGVDKFYGDDGDDVLYGRDGNDRLRSGNGNDMLYGGNGNDVLDGGANDDVIAGQAGNDVVRGRRDNDTITGGEGNDILFGDAGSDTIDGGNGNDQVFGVNEDDTVSGGAGADLVDGGLGNDVVNGGTGNDRLRGDGGNDILNGNNGNDRIDGGGNDDTIDGGNGNDILYGNNHNDTIRGAAGADQVFGNHGDDNLYGGASVDTLRGGVGNDGLFGGVGAVDVMFGDSGKDRFLAVGVESIRDLKRADARIDFKNSNSAWNDREIEIVDAGLAKLHMATGNTRLLRDSVPSGDYEFIKVAVLPNNLDGRNVSSFNTTTVTKPNGQVTSTTTYERKIEFDEWNEKDERFTAGRSLLVVHELLHSWDSVDHELRLGAPGSTGLWSEFLRVSGWRDSNPGNAAYSRSIDGKWWYVKSADFVYNYSRTNPNEDWSTVWERYFQDDAGPVSASMQRKLNVVQKLINAVSRQA